MALLGDILNMQQQKANEYMLGQALTQYHALHDSLEELYKNNLYSLVSPPVDDRRNELLLLMEIDE